MRFLRHFFTNWQNLIALALIGLFVFCALAAPLLAPPADPAQPTSYRMVEGQTSLLPLPPSEEAALGTVVWFQTSHGAVDLVHFDTFHSLVWGARDALRFGLITALITALIGVTVGAISGTLGGRGNAVIMRITDAFLCFPVIAGVWLFRTILDSAGMVLYDYSTFGATTPPQTTFQRLVFTLGIDPVMLAFILFSWMPYARLINANVLKLKGADYVMAARSVGANSRRVIFRHLLPNAVTPAIVLAARDIGGMVVLRAAFAFIGVTGAAQSSAIAEWDRLLLLSRTWVIGQAGNPFTYWWIYLPATLALILFGVGWNVLGDGLNSVLNPRE